MPDFGRWNANGGDPSLNEINRTDSFLDALATQRQPYSTDRGDAELAELLAGWRDDVRETPMGHVATPEQASTALDRVTRSAPRRRFSLAVVGSAAAAMLAIGGFGAVIAGSGPGDALYGMRTMLFGEQAQTRDDAVILAAQTEMQQVQQLIDQGDWQGAQAKLEAVTTTVATVDDTNSKEALVTQWQELTVKVEAQNATATIPPGAPLPTFPDLPVAVVDPATSASDTSASATSASDTSSPSASTSPSSETASPSSGTTSPSATTPPPVTTPPSATSPAPSTAGTSPPPGATSATPAPSSSPTSIPPSVTTTASPLPTSTTVVLQSTTTRAPLPTPTSVAAPSPTPTPIPTTAAPTSVLPTVLPTVEDEVEQPSVQVPTTTTFLAPPGLG